MPSSQQLVINLFQESQQKKANTKLTSQYSNSDLKPELDKVISSMINSQISIDQAFTALNSPKFSDFVRGCFVLAMLDHVESIPDDKSQIWLDSLINLVNYPPNSFVIANISLACNLVDYNKSCHLKKEHTIKIVEYVTISNVAPQIKPFLGILSETNISTAYPEQLPKRFLDKILECLKSLDIQPIALSTLRSISKHQPHAIQIAQNGFMVSLLPITHRQIPTDPQAQVSCGSGWLILSRIVPHLEQRFIQSLAKKNTLNYITGLLSSTNSKYTALDCLSFLLTMEPFLNEDIVKETKLNEFIESAQQKFEIGKSDEQPTQQTQT